MIMNISYHNYVLAVNCKTLVKAIINDKSYHLWVATKIMIADLILINVKFDIFIWCNLVRMGHFNILF